MMKTTFSLSQHLGLCPQIPLKARGGFKEGRERAAIPLGFSLCAFCALSTSGAVEGEPVHFTPTPQGL